MNNKDEKEYIEPEVLGGNGKENFGKKAADRDADFASDKMNDQINDMKKAALVKGGALLLPYIFGGILFLAILFGLIFLIFDNPFDYIISGVLLFFMIRGIMRMLKIFK